MLKYHIKTEIDGVEIRLIQSPHGYAVLYGMDRKTYTLADKKLAIKSYKECVNHALELNGMGL